jgi:hypothetical protein
MSKPQLLMPVDLASGISEAKTRDDAGGLSLDAAVRGDGLMGAGMKPKDLCVK